MEIYKPKHFYLNQNNTTNALEWLYDTADKLTQLEECYVDSIFDNYFTQVNSIFTFNYDHIQRPLYTRFKIEYQVQKMLVRELLTKHPLFNNIPNKETIRIF